MMNNTIINENTKLPNKIPFSTVFIAIVTFLIMVVIIKKDDVNSWLTETRVRNFIEDEYSFETAGVTAICNLDDLKGINLYNSNNEKISTNEVEINRELFEGVMFDSARMEDVIVEFGSEWGVRYETLTDMQTAQSLFIMSDDVKEFLDLKDVEEVYILFDISVPNDTEKDIYLLRYIKIETAENEKIAEFYLYY